MTKTKIDNLANILSAISSYVLSFEALVIAAVSFMTWMFSGIYDYLIAFQITIIMMALPLFLQFMANSFKKIFSILLGVNSIIKLAVAIWLSIFDLMLIYSSVAAVLSIGTSAGTLICLLISKLCCNKYTA